MFNNKTIVLIDGENMVLRFQELKNSRKALREGLAYRKDVYIWNPQLTQHPRMSIIRVSYYTTFVGADKEQSSLKDEIAKLDYHYRWGPGVPGSGGSLCPYVYKKEKKTKKTKSVDINITIDALRHTYNNSIDMLYLLSGDGDYIPLIEEVMRQGKKVIVGAFSSGLNPGLKHVPDQFIDIDHLFF